MLDQIRSGGNTLVLVTLERLSEAVDEVRRGHFAKAQERCNEAMGKLHALAHAEECMSGLAGAFIIRALNLEEGMILHNLGAVTSKRVEEIDYAGMDEPHRVVHLEFDNGHTATVAWDAELSAIRDA